MIILHFDLQLQFKYMNYYFMYTSHHFTPHGRYELNKLASLPMCGFIAQLVEHRTGIAEVTGSNPVAALIFFRLLLSNCLNWKIYCDDHSSLWLFACVNSLSIFLTINPCGSYCNKCTNFSNSGKFFNGFFGDPSVFCISVPSNSLSVTVKIFKYLSTGKFSRKLP